MIGDMIAKIRKEKGISKTELSRNQYWPFNTH